MQLSLAMAFDHGRPLCLTGHVYTP